MQYRSNLVNSNDHVYYDAQIYNNTNDLQNATFIERRQEPIVQNANDYYLSVIRFNVPASQIPLFLWPSVNNLADNTQYSVTLSYNGNDYQQFVRYQPLNTVNIFNFFPVFSYQHLVDMINLAFSASYAMLNAANPGIASSAPFMGYDDKSGFFTLYYAPEYISSNIGIFMNRLFDFFISWESIYNGYTTSVNGKVYQIITNNNNNNYITYLPPQVLNPPPNGAWSGIVTYNLGDIVSSGGVNYVSIVNGNLNHIPPNAAFWAPLPDNVAVPLEWQLATAYLIGNIVLYQGNYYIARTNNTALRPGTDSINWDVYRGFNFVGRTQEYSTLFLISSLRKIVFTTSLIPVANEYIAPPNTNVQNVGATSQDNSRPILTDFEIINEISVSNPARGYISYTPTGEYKLLDLKSDSNLKSFDIQVFYQDNRGRLFPLQLAPNELLSIKILFRKKSLGAGFGYHKQF